VIGYNFGPLVEHGRDPGSGNSVRPGRARQPVFVNTSIGQIEDYKVLQGGVFDRPREWGRCSPTWDTDRLLRASIDPRGGASGPGASLLGAGLRGTEEGWDRPAFYIVGG